MIFSKKPFAKDMTEKLTVLFASIENIGRDYEYGLFTSLCMMIKYHFANEEKIRELITMISEKMYEEELENLPFLERIKTKLAERETECNQLKSEISKRNVEITERDAEIIKKNAKISARDAEIIEKNAKISARDAEISEKDKKIANLERILLENNIII